MQETITASNRIENLLQRIIALEEHFGTRPDDVGDQRRRRDLIEYDIIFSQGIAVLSSP